MPWIQVKIGIDKVQIPLVEWLLNELGALSITLSDAKDQPILEPAPGETPLWAETEISAVFPGNTDIEQLCSCINNALEKDMGTQMDIEVLEDQAWERLWLKHFEPQFFGHRLWVCPQGKTVNDPDAVVIYLDPGLAFGTGTHPTTRLCLRWLDEQAAQGQLQGKTLIDYGCGSGILAIAALKLGAEKVIAVDNDPQALTATKQNAIKNGVLNRLGIMSHKNRLNREVDIVLANILANVLIQLAPRILPLIKPQGQLVLSGLLEEQAVEVQAAYQEAIQFESKLQDEEWLLLQGRKR